MNDRAGVDRTITRLDVTVEPGITGVAVDFGMNVRTLDILPDDARRLAECLNAVADVVEQKCIDDIPTWLTVPLDMDVIMRLKMLMYGAASPHALPAGFTQAVSHLAGVMVDVAVLYAAIAEIDAATAGADVLASLTGGTGARARAADFLRWIALLPTVPPRLRPAGRKY